MTVKIKALKRWGQHFLKNSEVLVTITKRIEEIQSRSKLNAITEIGPGLGALTDYLHPLFSQYCVMEKDQRFSQTLERYIPALHILWGDTLKQEWYECPKGILVGNLPYNISLPIMLRWLRYSEHFPEAVFMVQKEVGARVMAVPFTKAYGRLSVMMQSVAQSQLVLELGPECFVPSPKVWSYVIHLRRNTRKVDFDILEFVLKHCFSQRRKILKNSLINFTKIFPEQLVKDGLTSVGASMQDRPEALTTDQYIKFSEYIKKSGSFFESQAKEN
ncbi:ribosomal RNA small subunit methyltransferase A [Holospora elegans E1]|uniref:Ribosomal RNA small subunit methyltransferase A n=1 Tax=Holospora elegans E1 TaxID=1427503 RepID=A0A023DY02_9PROT|nr:16S rRNA (adenine(1518)-N(6)/adenine(1519)-N(6))-dimethyltransferase RsmA [Holospora elegans]GAJ46331.1 ribosomal RNA small subunit methyltransferase A [Holospora elegans E1]